MPLVNAKCTNCGANLTVDESKDAAICEFCGAAYIVEKAVQNYQTVNNYQGQVVNVINIYNDRNSGEKAEKASENVSEDYPLCNPVRVTCIKGFNRITGLGSVFDLTVYRRKMVFPDWKKRGGKIDYEEIVQFSRISRGLNLSMTFMLKDESQYTFIFKKRDMDVYNKCAELIEADLNKRRAANT